MDKKSRTNDKKIMRRATYKLLPSKSQLSKLNDLMVHHHQLYNWALKDRIETYRDFNYSLTYGDQSLINKQYRDARKKNGIFNAYSQSEQTTLKRVDLAFKGFFRRLKTGGNPGFPRLQSFNRFSGWGYPQHRNGWEIHLNQPMIKNGKAIQKHGKMRISDVGNVRIKGQARLAFGKPKTCDIMRKVDGWYASVVFEYTQEDMNRQKGEDVIGLDWGVETFITQIDEDENIKTYSNPRINKAYKEELVLLQRDLALCSRGSRRYKKVKRQIALWHKKQSDRRKDYSHKVTTQIISSAKVIALEELEVKSMTKKVKGNKRKGKAGLNREILDTAPSRTYGFLQYKAEEAGVELAMVPTKKVKPSQTCPMCNKQEKKKLSQRLHECTCGCTMQRDAASSLVCLNYAIRNFIPNNGTAIGSEVIRNGLEQVH